MIIEIGENLTVAIGAVAFAAVMWAYAWLHRPTKGDE